MDKTQQWYAQKKLDRMTILLLQKQYLVHKAESQEEAEQLMSSFLSDDNTVTLGDTWNFNHQQFINTLQKYNPNIVDFTERRIQLISDIGILEGEYLTKNGEIILVGDYNTALGIFGAKQIYIFLSQNSLIDNFFEAIRKIKEMEKYYKERTQNQLHLQENVSIGIIENGRKFDGRIHIILYQAPILIL